MSLLLYCWFYSNFLTYLLLYDSYIIFCSCNVNCSSIKLSQKGWYMIIIIIIIIIIIDVFPYIA
jgi:hypothetical protein